MVNAPSHTPLFYVTLSGSRGFPKRDFDNILISAGSLWSTQRKKFIRRNPPPHSSFFLDSGGFTALHRFGGYPFTREEYLDLIWHYAPDLVATMDYPCEPDINRGGLQPLCGREGLRRVELCGLESNAERIRATVENAAWLLGRDVPADTTVIPVVQGYTLDEYMACLDLYEERGILEAVEYLGIGSMCRRELVGRIAPLVVRIVDRVWTTRPAMKFHLFGLKLTALRNAAIFSRTHSVDSAAWSLDPRRGHLYEKDPVGAGWLDLYLAKVAATCDAMKCQSTLEVDL